MFRKGFDNDKYIALQSQKIRDRIDQFGGKLYLEFGVREASPVCFPVFCRTVSSVCCSV